jgi:hypothetical protein
MVIGYNILTGLLDEANRTKSEQETELCRCNGKKKIN